MLPPVTSQALDDATEAFNRGDASRAAALAAQSLKEIQSPQAVYIQALAMVAQKMLREAENLLQENKGYLEQWPDSVGMAAHVRGRIALMQGNVAAALPYYRRAHELLPNDTSCMIDYAEALFHASQFEAAHGMYQRALMQGPPSGVLYNNLAACSVRMQQYDQAFAYSYVGRANFPTAVSARQIGMIQLMSNNIFEAIKHFSQAIKLGDETIESLRGIAECYRRLGYHRRVLHFVKRALRVAPQQSKLELLKEILHCYMSLGEGGEAIPYTEQLWALAPKDIGLILNFVNLYQTECDFDQALAWCEKAEKISPGHPDVQYARGYIELFQGKWKEGWRDYEVRWKTTAYGGKYGAVVSPLKSPMWDGKASLKGKVVMALCEQGAGDLIQFGVYIKRLVELGATVDILGPPFMTELLTTMPWVRAAHDNYFKIPPHDYHVSTMTMPLYEGTTVETIPVATEPYLRAPRKRGRFSKKFTVAIAWAGDPRNSYNAWRSIPTHLLYDLFKKNPNVQFVSLQMPPHDRVTQRYLKSGLIMDGMDGATTFTDTAAAIDAADLVISVCTAAAHVAGAMHKPTWLLLSKYADWRWLGAESTTRWYPTMKVFRQKKTHDWRELLNRVSNELKIKIKNDEW